MASLFKRLFPTFVVLLMGVSPALGGINTVYDFADSISKAKVTGAMSAEKVNAESGGVSKQSLFLHPTTGDARADYSVTLPEVPKDGALVLSFSAAVKDGITTDDKDHPFDGVDFAVEIDGKRVWELKDREKPGWQDASVDLSPYAGKKVDVTFITNPRGNSNYDWAVYGEPRVLALSGGYSPGISIPAVKGIILTSDAAEVSVKPINSSGIQLPDIKTVKTEGFAAIPFDFTRERANSIYLLSVSKGSTKVYPYEPNAQISAVGLDRAVVFAGEGVKVRAAVKNTGEGPFTTLQPLTLQLGNEEGTRRQITSLFPGEEVTVDWPWRAPRTVSDGFVWVRAIPPTGGEGISKMSSTVAVYANPDKLPAPGEKASASTLGDGSVALMNKSVLLLILPRDRVVENEGSMELPAAMLYVRVQDGWQRVGSIAPLGKLWIDGVKDAQSAKVKMSPVTTKGSASVEASVWIGERRYYGITLTLADTGGIKFSSAADLRSGEVLRTLAGPLVLAGDGAFGEDRSEAIFPGLEYLLQGERSSGQDFAHPPYDLRLAPDPNKVTIPVMAVRSGDYNGDFGRFSACGRIDRLHRHWHLRGRGNTSVLLSVVPLCNR